MSLLGKDTDSTQIQSPQDTQSDLQPGVIKGFVVDVKDPWQAGRVRVASYSMQGDYPHMDIEALRWAEPMWGSPGAFTPPPLGGRVWLNFEGGEKYTQMYQGSWSATPMGGGLLPWNKRVGSEIRPEAWHTRDLYPESMIAIASQEGNVIWLNQLFIGQKYLASSINMMDTSGKFFRVKSVHDDAKPFFPVDLFPDGEGALYNTDFGETKATRTGVEQIDSLDITTGSVDFGHQTARQTMFSFKSENSINQFQQDDADANTNIVDSDISSTVRQRRIKTNAAISTANATYNSGVGIFAQRALQPPRIW